MPDIDVTYEQSVGPGWTAVAGPGRVFIANAHGDETLRWAIGGPAAPTGPAGYGLPPFRGYRSRAEAIVVPENRTLWLRSDGPAGTAHPVVLTVAALP